MAHEIQLPAWLWRIIVVIVSLRQPTPQMGGPGLPGHGPGGNGGHLPGHGHGPGSPSSTLISGSSPYTGSGSGTSTGNPTETGGTGGPGTSISSTSSNNITSSSNTSRDTSSTTSTTSQPSSTVPVQKCPEGFAWTTFADDFEIYNEAAWSIDGFAERYSFGKNGLSLNINQSSIYVTFTSKAKWVAPVTVEVDIQSAATGGCPTTLNMLNAEQSGSEIDLELSTFGQGGSSSHMMQLPIWKPSPTGGNAVKLDYEKGTELEEKIFPPTVQDTAKGVMPSWGYSYPGYDAAKFVHYTLEWLPNSVTWSTDNVKRVSFINRKAETYPHSALAINLSVWAVSKDNKPNTWAGTLDWPKHPNPVARFKGIKVAGCQKKA